MQELVSLLGSVSAGSALGWLVAIVLAVVTVYKWAEKYRTARNQYEETKEQTQKNAHAISQLEQQVSANKRAYKEHFEALEQKDNEIIDRLSQLTKAIQSIESYQKKRDIANLKDRIQNAYKTYRQRAKYNNGEAFITQNEEEILKGLIDAYENAGGDSFIHTKVIPALSTWEVVTQQEFINRMSKVSQKE